jgi:transcriptional regulator with XRE-family HTH domain
MSPFAEALRTLRFERGLRQFELANLLDCPRSYISALENDINMAPPIEFVEKLGVAIELSVEAKAALQQALERSCRGYHVPDDAPRQVYEFVYDLFQKIDRLSAAKLEALGKVLNLPDQAVSFPRQHEARVRRSDRRQADEENAM